MRRWTYIRIETWSTPARPALSPWWRRAAIALLVLAVAWTLLDVWTISQMPERAFRRGRSGTMFVVAIFAALQAFFLLVALFDDEDPTPGILLACAGLARGCLGVQRLVMAEDAGAIAHVGVWLPFIWCVACVVVGVQYVRACERNG